MTITVEAIYENGTLKLSQPLPLKEQEKVQVTIQAELPYPRRGQARIVWTGSLEDLDYLINDVENDPLEAATELEHPHSSMETTAGQFDASSHPRAS